MQTAPDADDDWQAPLAPLTASPLHDLLLMLGMARDVLQHKLSPPPGFAGLWWPSGALYSVQAALAQVQRLEQTWMPCPWRYAMGAKVRVLRPETLHDDMRQWYAMPYRVIGRGVTELDGGGRRITYCVQPWDLTGTWMVDRPLTPLETEIAPWEEAMEESR